MKQNKILIILGIISFFVLNLKASENFFLDFSSFKYASFNTSDQCQGRAQIDHTKINLQISYLREKNVLFTNFEKESSNPSKEELELFKNLTQPRDIFGTRDESVSLAVQQKMKNNCTSIFCQVKNIFGEELGVKLFYLLSRFNLNASYFAFVNAEKPSFEDLEIWLKTLNYVPLHLSVFNPNQKLSRYKENLNLGKRLYADATMSFFDIWSKADESFRIYTTYHEFSHNFASSGGFDLANSSDWLKISGWKKQTGSQERLKINKEWDYSFPHKFVSKYAESNPAEDFAESSVAYRFFPKLLRQVSPEKYYYLKVMVYSGEEFLEDNCSQSRNESGLVQRESIQKEFISQKDYWLKKTKIFSSARCFDSLLMNEFSAIFLKKQNQRHSELEQSKADDLEFCLKKEVVKQIAQKRFGINEMPLSLFDRSRQKVLLPDFDLTLFREDFFEKMQKFCHKGTILTNGDVAELVKSEIDGYYSTGRFPNYKYSILKDVLNFMCQ